MDGKIRLKYIDKLINEEIYFTVPDYQRGYKWTIENINELLNDILSLEDGEEYCLMPIIVRPTKNVNGNDVIEIVRPIVILDATYKRVLQQPFPNSI